LTADTVELFVSGNSQQRLHRPPPR